MRLDPDPITDSDVPPARPKRAKPASTRRRWTCPKCATVKLAPERARKDDTNTYCLGCSENTGRLVKRVAEAVEVQRAVRKEKAKEKAKLTAIKARETYIVAGFDFDRELARLWLRRSPKRAPGLLT